MIGALMGLPGKLKTLSDRLSAVWAAKLDTLATDYTTARAAKIDNLSVNVNTLATASGLTSAVAPLAIESSPVLAVPISNGIVPISGASTANISLQTVVSYTGKGVLEFCAFAPNSSQSIQIDVVIDGVTAYTYSGAPGSNVWKSIVGYCSASAYAPICLGAVPFKTSLLIRQSSNGSNLTTAYYIYRKTA